ncbi:MAG: [FeFe] hydrogenase H-cluster radical SAM maturase HydG [Candidatus Omnitrophota bacterium]|jgi:2-iminoacetate synthase
MKHINAGKISDLIGNAAKASEAEVEAILAKSRSLKRLSLEDSAALLMVEDKALLDKIFSAAYFVKEKVYGRRVVLFAPLYISNFCVNKCLYCAFRADNKLTKRRRLDISQIRQQTRFLLERGHKRILMVAGEVNGGVDFYVQAIREIYEERLGAHAIKRININCAPLEVDEFRKLKEAGIGTYQIFQETYHDSTYRIMHPTGPKSDPDNRIDSIDRAFQAGIDDIGMGVLYGLYDYRFDTLAMLSHIEYLEKAFGIGPHTISVPRIEPAQGTEFKIPYPVSDDDFKKLVAVLRLSVPYTGMILSTRETAEARDELCGFGISQISAESRTSPGGYSCADNNADSDVQFCIGDQRTLDEIIGTLISKDFIPSFCAACYRRERTGEAFMNLAKPGLIKDKCSFNALVTLKEYLDDFASPGVKKAGYGLIGQARKSLDERAQLELNTFFRAIDKGVRDAYV